MNTTWRLIVVTLLLAGIAEAQNTNSAKPNVVIIYADDMGFGDMGAYGTLYGTTPPAPTPHMDTLASEGLMLPKPIPATASAPRAGTRC